MRILVIEDEPSVSSLLERGLREEGYLPTTVSTLDAARTALLGSSFDLLLVDRMLPDGDGLTLIQELRSRNQRVPILMLTARDRIDDRVEGLYGGADDYLTKPFSFEELLARVSAVCRRFYTERRLLQVGELTIDLDALRVRRGDSEISLTAQELKLLLFLAEHQGKILSKTRLLEAVWDTQHDPGTNIVEVYISYLRTKIDRGHQQKLIHTVRGLGYILEPRA